MHFTDILHVFPAKSIMRSNICHSLNHLIDRAGDCVCFPRSRLSISKSRTGIAIHCHINHMFDAAFLQHFSLGGVAVKDGTERECFGLFWCLQLQEKHFKICERQGMLRKVRL